MGSCFSFFCRIFSGVFSFLGGDTPGPEFRENLRERGPRSPANRALGFDPPLGGTRQAARRAGADTPWRGPVGSPGRRAHPWAGGKAPGGAGGCLPAGTRSGARRRFPPGHRRGARWAAARRKNGAARLSGHAGLVAGAGARAGRSPAAGRRGGTGANGAKSGGARGRARRRLFRRGGYTVGGGGAAQRGRRQRRLVLRRGV